MCVLTIIGTTLKFKIGIVIILFTKGMLSLKKKYARAPAKKKKRNKQMKFNRVDFKGFLRT